MSLAKQLQTTLRQIGVNSADAPAYETLDGGRQRLTVADTDLRAQLTFRDCDRYSVTLQTLEVIAGTGAALTTASVQRDASSDSRANAIIAQLGYLEEPLAVCEASADDALVQLRSAPPLLEDSTIFYWEVVLRSGEQPAASLTRYHWEPGMVEREIVDYPATFALVGRIAESLSAALRAE